MAAKTSLVILVLLRFLEIWSLHSEHGLPDPFSAPWQVPRPLSLWGAQDTPSPSRRSSPRVCGPLALWTRDGLGGAWAAVMSLEHRTLPWERRQVSAVAAFAHGCDETQLLLRGSVTSVLRAQADSKPQGHRTGRWGCRVSETVWKVPFS